MEGLDITEISLSTALSSSDDARLDAGFFVEASAEELLKKKQHTSLAAVSTWITQGPNPDLKEEGYPCFTGRNIATGFLESGDPDFVDDAGLDAWRRFKLQHLDLLITLKGAGSTGQVALVEANSAGIFSRNLGLIRLNEANKHRAYFLWAFLGTKLGQRLIDRGVTGGTGQLTLPTSQLKRLVIPVQGAPFEEEIKRNVQRMFKQRSEAAAHLATAEQTLLRALGLENWRPPEPLTYVRRASEVAAAARFDALYFSPAKSDSVRVLKANGAKPLSDYFDTVRDMVSPEDITNARVLNFDVGAASQAVIDETSPSVVEFDSAKKRFHPGDVIISRLRHYLRQIAVVRTPPDATTLGSSEFIVLRPKSNKLPQEALVLFLRCLPVQKILEFSQDGSHHPRFSEDDLLAIPVPDDLLKIAAELTAAVRAAHAARREAQSLLARARRAVEVAIEQGETAALALLAEPSGSKN